MKLFTNVRYSYSVVEDLKYSTGLQYMENI